MRSISLMMVMLGRRTIMGSRLMVGLLGRMSITSPMMGSAVALAVGHLSQVSRVAVNVVLDGLHSAVGEEDVVGALRLLAVPVFVVAKVDGGAVLVLGVHLVAVLVVGRLVVVVAVAMVCLGVVGEGDGCKGEEEEGDGRK